MDYKYSEEAAEALKNGSPIVALESTVIAHGLPYPQNLETAFKLEKIVRDRGAVPATIAVFGGEFFVGLDDKKLQRLAESKTIHKISRRDLPLAVANKWDCATTVATTMFVAHRAGIKVFATGGIGGVHRGSLPDISADLPELAQTPMTVVCAGAKIVLDLPATREWLETHGITVLGYQCDEMPAFYSRSSGLPVDARVNSAVDATRIIRARNDLGLNGSVLVTVPIPSEFEVPCERLEDILDNLLSEADDIGIKGKEITPFLLKGMSERSGGDTLKANIALLENNVKVASEIAVELARTH